MLIGARSVWLRWRQSVTERSGIDMPTQKFDETDRGTVIVEVEKHFDVRLSKVGNFRKYLQDASGKSYWIFGGYEGWHEVTAKMLDEERRRSTDGVLVVAKRNRTSIEIFSGQLAPLIANSRDLSHTEKGDHQFNVVVRDNLMTIKEISGLTLRKLGAPKEVGLAESLKLRELEAMLAKMSPDERTKLLEQLSGKSKG